MKHTKNYLGFFVIFLILAIAINAYSVSAENLKAQQITINPATTLIDVNTSILFTYQFTSDINPTLSVPIQITLSDGTSWTETVTATNSTINNAHTFNHVFTSAGTYDVNITIDPLNIITEDNELDNELSTTVTITGAIYNVGLSSTALTTTQGTNAVGTIVASNNGNVHLYSVTLVSSNFVSTSGTTIPASSITLAPSLIGTFFRNTSNDIDMTIAVPITTSAGNYTGNITLTYNNGTANIDVISPITLEVTPELSENLKAQEIIINPATTVTGVNTSILFKYEFNSNINPTLSVPIQIILGDGTSWTETVTATNSVLNNTHTFYHVFTVSGTYDVNITIDPLNTITEDDELDNFIATIVTIADAIYDATLTSTALTTVQGIDAQGTIIANNTGNTHLYSVALTSSDFVSTSGTILSSAVTLNPLSIGTFFRNTSNDIDMTIAVPITTSAGNYTGNITLTYNNGTANVDVISPITLEVLPFSGNFKVQQITINPATTLVGVSTSMILEYQFTSATNPSVDVPIRIDLGDGTSWTETVTATNSTLNNTHTFSHVFTSAGTYDVNITIDPLNTITEDDELDNFIATTVTIADAIYNVTLTSASMTTYQGTNAQGSITASNLGNVHLYNITLISSNFVSVSGTTIPASSVTLTPSSIGTFFRNTSDNMNMVIAVPLATPIGTYVGNVTLTYNNGTADVDVIATQTLTVLLYTAPSTGTGGGGGGGGGGFGTCYPSWKCEDWSVCGLNGKHTRICTDLNNCYQPATFPPIEENCSIIINTTIPVNNVTPIYAGENNQSTNKTGLLLTGLAFLGDMTKSGWFIAAVILIVVALLVFFAYRWMNKPHKKKSRK